MTIKEKNTIRAEIEKRIIETKQKIEDLQQDTDPIEPSVALGRLTRMDAMQNQQMVEANIRSSQDVLSKLYTTLSHIDSKDFGICRDCAKTIPLERVILIPESRLCVQCASKKPY